jgi:hypothetical protein
MDAGARLDGRYAKFRAMGGLGRGFTDDGVAPVAGLSESVVAEPEQT